jgi:hypothetical protein
MRRISDYRLKHGASLCFGVGYPMDDSLKDDRMDTRLAPAFERSLDIIAEV